MSLALDGASQFAEYVGTGLIGPSVGVSNWPITISAWFKATATAGAQSIVALCQNGNDTNRMVGRIGGGNIVCTEYAQGNLADFNRAGVVAGQWHLGIWTFAGKASRSVSLDDATTTDATDVTVFTSNIDRFLVGAVKHSSTALYFGGLVAHVAAYRAVWNDAYRTALYEGADPRSIPGCCEYFPLETDYTNLMGAWTLTGTGSPTFNAADHPAVDPYTWPAAAGNSGVSRGRLVNAGAG